MAQNFKKFVHKKYFQWSHSKNGHSLVNSAGLHTSLAPNQKPINSSYRNLAIPKSAFMTNIETFKHQLLFSKNKTRHRKMRKQLYILLSIQNKPKRNFRVSQRF